MSLHTLYQWCFNVLWYALWWFVYFPGRQWFHAVAFWRLLEATPSELKAFLTTEHLPRAFARKVMDESVTWLKLDKQTVWYIYILIYSLAPNGCVIFAQQLRKMFLVWDATCSQFTFLYWPSSLEFKSVCKSTELQLIVRAYNHGHRARKRSKLLWMHLGRFLCGVETNCFSMKCSHLYQLPCRPEVSRGSTNGTSRSQVNGTGILVEHVADHAEHVDRGSGIFGLCYSMEAGYLKVTWCLPHTIPREHTLVILIGKTDKKAYNAI